MNEEMLQLFYQSFGYLEMSGRYDIFYQMAGYSSALAVITTAVIAAIKSAFTLPKNVLPLLSIIVGALVGLASAYIFPGASLPVLIWAGALSGSAGVGLHETFKKREGYTKE